MMMGKKRFATVFALLIALVFTCAVLGCAKKDKTDDPPSHVDPVRYTVIFDGNGGVFDGGGTTYTETVDEGACAVGKTPTRGGYDFAYWYRSSAPNTEIVLASTPINADERFYASWEPQTTPPTEYTITVASATGGTVTADRSTAAAGETVTLTVAPTSGYRLTSLKYNTTDIDITGSSYTFVMPSGNVTVQAAFEREEEVTLSGIAATTLPAKTSYIAGQTLDLTGLVVTASYSDGSSRTVTDYTTTPASGAVLGTETGAVAVSYGGKTTSFPISVAARAVTSLEMTGTLEHTTQYVGSLLDTSGLTFTATYNDGESETVTPTFMSYALSADGRLQTPGSSVEITASFGGRQVRFTLSVETPAVPLHDIIFDANNGAFASYIEDLPATRTVEEGSGTNEPDAPTLKGFEFGGWYKESICETAWDFAVDKMGTTDVTLYAKWTATEYDVTYTLGGGTNASTNPAKYKATDGEITLASPTRANYDFDGWYTVAGVKVEKIDYARIVQMTAADIKLQARWTAKKYDITYILGGSDSTYEATLSQTAPVKYTFGTVTALPGSSYVTVVNKDGDSVPYTFMGWYLQGDATETIVDNITADMSGDKTFVAKIEKKTTFAFTFDYGYDYNGDGKTTSTRNIVENEKAIDRDLAGTRVGYSFGGWFEDSGTFLNAYDFDTPVTAAKTIYAKWTPVSYTVEYVGDGFTKTPTTYKITDTAVALGAPELQTGYYFDGWFLDEGCEGVEVTTLDASIIGNADGENKITLYAKSSNVYNVVYNANKPAGVENTTSGMPPNGTVVYGEKIPVPTSTPDLPNYGFSGWYTDAACENAWDFDTAVDGAAGISATNRTFDLYVKWYEKPSDGKYILGSFNGWGDALKGGDAAGFKAEIIRFDLSGGTQIAKEWRISGLTLKAGDEFKFVDYTKTGGISWNEPYANADGATSVKFYVRPNVMTVALTAEENPNYKIATYTLGEGNTWTVEFGTNEEGKTYVTFTLDGYIEWRDPTGEGDKPTKAEELEDGVWYFAGNFTDWFSQTEAWSTKAAVRDGDRYYFTRVYLKKYDTFKVMSKSGMSQTWLGGTFGSLGTAFTLSAAGGNIELNGIEDGYYNIVFNASSYAFTLTEYKAATVRISANAPVYVGDTVTQDNLVVTADGNVVAAADYRILGTVVAKSGQNTVRIAYNGGIFEHTFTATELEIVSIQITKTPSKLWYFAGDALSTAGLEVRLIYNKSGMTETVTDLSKFDITATLVGNSTNLFAANTVTVTVALKENTTISTSYEVSVVNKVTSVTATAPTKTTYFVGDALDTTGMVVTAHFGSGDGAPAQAVTGFSTTPANGTALAASDTAITVSYRQALPQGCTLSTATLTCEIDGITVKIPQITAVAVAGSLDDAEYTVGETFDPTGLAFTATYENGSTKTLYADDMTFALGEYANASNMFVKAGSAVPVTVKCGAITATSGEPITVDVYDKLTSITVDATDIVKPHVAGFVEGDALTVNGIVVKAVYNEDVDGATVSDSVVSSGYSVSPALGSELVKGDTEVTVTYRGKTAKFTVTAVPRVMTALTVGGDPAMQYIGSKLNPTGLTFTAHFNDDTQEGVAPGNIEFTSDAMNDDGNFAVYGTGKTVTASYGGKTCEFTVDVDSTTQYLVQFVTNIPGTGKVPVGMPENQSVRHGCTVEEPTTVPTLKGYTFGGWYKEAACTTAWDFATETVTGNRTIYAKWTSKTYTIIYSVDGSTSVLPNSEYKATDDIYPEQALSTPDAKVGHDFVGWCLDADCGDAPFTSMTYARIPASDDETVILYAKFEPKEYTVSFDLRGGNAADAFADQTVEYNATATEPTATPTRTHYDFAFWYTDLDDPEASQFDFATPITDDLTVYASWAAYRYTVTYNLNGGTNASTNPAKYGIADGEVTLAPAVKTGYAFRGWKTADGTTVTKLTSAMLPDGRANAIVLTAEFEQVVTHTVTYHINYAGGTDPAPATVEDGTTVSKPTDPTRRGWTFGGWFEEVECLTEYMFGDAVTADVDLYAKWTRNTVKVSFDLNYEGAAVTEETIYQYDTAAAVRPTDPERSGYEFKGWFTEAECTTEYAFTAEVATALTLYAKWEKITGGYLVIGSDKRVMTDNSKNSEHHIIEYMLDGIALNAGDEIKFNVDGADVKVNIDGASKGIATATGLQSSIATSKAGTFEFYLYKTDLAETNWTVYATYAEYVEYYLVGAFTGNEAYKWASINTDFGLVGNTITLPLKKDDALQVVKNKDDDGTTIDWNNGVLDSSAVSVGVGYVGTDSDKNIIIKVDGNYTFKLVGGQIEITADVEEPAIDLSAYKTLEVAFIGKTITIAFDMPSWSTSDASLYIYDGLGNTAAWPGHTMDGSSITVAKNLADVQMIASFKQNDATKQTISLAGGLFADGTVFRINWGAWKSGDEFYATVTKLA